MIEKVNLLLSGFQDKVDSATENIGVDNIFGSGVDDCECRISDGSLKKDSVLSYLISVKNIGKLASSSELELKFGLIVASKVNALNIAMSIADKINRVYVHGVLVFMEEISNLGSIDEFKVASCAFSCRFFVENNNG